MKNPKPSPAVIFAAGLALTAALGLISIHVPFARDQGASAYVAWIMDHGGVVYRDVFHFNLPATYFAYLLALKLPLPIPESVNLMQVAVNLLGGVIVFLAARRVTGPRAAALAAGLFGAFVSALYTDYWDIAEKESLACLPLALALYGFIRTVGNDDGAKPAGSRDFFWAAMAGAMAGAAAQFKPTLGIVLACGLYAAWQRRGAWVRALMLAAACGAGFALSFLPLAAYVIAHDAGGPMYDFIFRFGGFYGGQQYEPGAWKSFTSAGWELGRWLYRWRSLALLAVFWPAGGRVAAPGKMTALFGLLLLVQVVVQGKYFTYHFIPLLLPGAIMAAAGGREIFRRAADSPRPARWALAALTALAVLDNLEPESGRYYRHILYDLGRTDEVTFLKPYGRWGEGDVNPLASQQVSAYIREHSGERDTIQVIGHESGIYVMAGRPAAARFHFDQPYMTDPKGDAAFEEYRAKMRAEVIESLAAKRPVYIVVIEDDATAVEPEDSFTQMKSFPELRGLLEAEYTLETKIEDFYLYRKNDRME